MTKGTDFYTHPKLLLLETAFDTARGALELINTIALTGGTASDCQEAAQRTLHAMRGIREDLPHTTAIKKLADVLPDFNTKGKNNG